VSLVMQRIRFFIWTAVPPIPDSPIKSPNYRGLLCRNLQICCVCPEKSELVMSHSLVCWRCGASLAGLSLPLRHLEVCKACNAELHVCKMCVEYDISYAKHCKEPTAEEVRKKDEANFCDHFKPKEGAYVAKNEAEIARSRSALDDLFRK
jgi:hypothetical protein